MSKTKIDDIGAKEIVKTLEKEYKKILKLMVKKMNIDYEISNYKFNARVSALIFNKNKDKILLFKIED